MGVLDCAKEVGSPSRFLRVDLLEDSSERERVTTYCRGNSDGCHDD
jgi:hypothetical protein